MSKGYVHPEDDGIYVHDVDGHHDCRMFAQGFISDARWVWEP